MKRSSRDRPCENERLENVLFFFHTIALRWRTLSAERIAFESPV